MSSNQGTAVAVFGSAARGDVDHLSDRDILLVGDNAIDLQPRAAQLRAIGWSPTLYTWERLQREAVVGRLFVQHLRTEGMIVSDPLGKLATLFSAFAPRSSYGFERVGATTLLGALEFVPRSPASALWALDVLAVAFRSLAVATLADEGQYTFDHAGLLASLMRRGCLNAHDTAALRQLRLFKRVYRGPAGTRVALPWSIPQRLLSIVDRVFGVGIHLKRVRAEEFVERTVSMHSHRADWYPAARQLEHVLDVLHVSDDTVRQRARVISALIRAPSDYGGHLAASVSDIRDEIGLWIRSGLAKPWTQAARKAA